MIIRFPTGLYKSVLPNGEKTGNFTYTVSTQEPPRTEVRLVKLPLAEELEPAPDRIFDDETRRQQFGELIYTVTRSSRSDPGSNKKQFELGEVLEFEEHPPVEELDPVLAPTQLDLRHDLNLIDLKSLGLSDTEIANFAKDSVQKQKTLEADFNRKNIEISNSVTAIGENQKKINEVTKAIRAVRQVYGIPDGDLSNPNVIYQKLLVELVNAEGSRDQLITQHNAAAAELKTISQAILRVAEFVK